MAKAEILVVEDESIVAETIEATLEELGYAIPGVASSGEEAIKKVGQVHPDLVLMDIHLGGGMDGVQAAEEISAYFDIPVVYLTGFADDETLQRAKVTEPYGYILKPFQERELETIIEIALYKHKVQRELKESRASFHNIVERSADGIAVVDQEGVVRFVNRTLESLLQCKKEDLVDQQFGYPVQTGATMEVGITRQEGEPGTGEMTVVETEWEGEVAHLVSLHDITERKEAEDLFKSLFNSSPIGIYIVQDGNFQFANPRFQELTGYSEGELLGTNSLRLVYTEDRDMVRENAIEMLKGERCSEYEYRCITRSGVIRWILETVAPIGYRGKRAVVGNFMDITERKQAEEAQRELERMKSEFVSNVSHELRNPLHSIKGFTRLMLGDEVPDFEAQKEFLTIIDNQSQHLGTLIDSLLDMARIESGRFSIEKQRLSVDKIINEVVEGFHRLASEKGIVIKQDIPTGLPEIEADGERLRQVMVNLLGNAIKFSDSSGSITVRAEARDGGLLVQVADHGTGIPKEAMPHLFERFYRAKDSMARGGAGLGLHISKQIIEAHDGRIWVESKVGEGSVFSFTLPVNKTGGGSDE